MCKFHPYVRGFVGAKGDDDAGGQLFRVSICLDDVNQQTDCGSAFYWIINSQGPDLLDIPVRALRRYDLLYKEPCHGGAERADVPTALGGQRWATSTDERD